VELRKSGRSYKARCPFHEEKTASFHVTPELRRFKCFGCQAGGDVIAFVQRYLGRSFVDAVRELAREVGVDLESAVDPLSEARRQLREVTDVAAEHFKGHLWNPQQGRVAREYLAGRGVTEETARRFGLGWAPLSWNELTDALLKAGMLDWGLSAGLVHKRPQAEGYYDVFRGRLIVPIRSPEGRTVAFGGRLLEGEAGPKYLNSRESPLYSKSETLYGMDQAREEIRRRRCAILVEGYFDCIALHQAGIRNVVALCSTALTSGHLSLLARGDAKELILFLDGDEAGRKGIERVAGVLLSSGASARVALLPENQDPDSFVQTGGEAAARAVLERARPLTEHLFNEALPRGRQGSFEDKMSAVERLKPIAAAMPVGLVRSAFFAAMGNHFGLPAAELESALRGRPGHFRPAPKLAPSPGGTAPVIGKPGPERPPDPLESTFVAALLRQPQLKSKDPFGLVDQLAHAGLRALVAYAESDGTEEAMLAASGTVRDALEASNKQLPADEAGLEQLFLALCRKLKLRRIDEQLSYIARAVGQVDGANDWSEETKRLQGERISLLALRKQVLQGSGEITAGTNEAG
jgi:DNA primase